MKTNKIEKIKMIKPQEQFRIRIILLREKLEELGWVEYVDFVDDFVNRCTKEGKDASKMFRMLGRTKKREGNWSDISIERCLELEKGQSYSQKDQDQWCGNHGHLKKDK